MKRRQFFTLSGAACATAATVGLVVKNLDQVREWSKRYANRELDLVVTDCGAGEAYEAADAFGEDGYEVLVTPTMDGYTITKRKV